MAYRTPVDIGNRALQILGQFNIDGFDEDSREAGEIGRGYDNLRLAELSRHAWAFSVRRVRLRPVTFSMQIWTPPAWAVGTAYTVGQIVLYTGAEYTPDGISYPWILGVPTSTGDTPDISPKWGHYFGTLCVDVFDNGINYAAGELTLVPETYAGGTTYAAGNMVTGPDSLFYVSLANSNVGHTPSSSPTFWEPWVVPSSGTPQADSILYTTGVSFKNTPSVYVSLVNQNGPGRQDPTGLPATYPLAWTAISGGTITKLTPLFPADSGPLEQTGTTNLYHLPFGFLRDAQDFAKWAKHPWLGALYGQMPRDLTYWDQYFTTSRWTPVDFPFLADIADVTLMPPQFCECVAIRMAEGVDEALTGGKNAAKIERLYKRVTGEAMRSDMIMQGEAAEELEELIRVRY